MVRLKELFRGHNDLIYGFNAFLPSGYEMTPEDEEDPQKEPVGYAKAVYLMGKIKVKKIFNLRHFIYAFNHICACQRSRKTN